MVDIIQTSKCVDDVSAQHKVNMLNKKFANIIRPVCMLCELTSEEEQKFSPCFTQWQIFALREIL